MSCSQDDLEALARDELPRPAAQRVLGHVSGCDGCARELAWLHTEAALARRPDEPADLLWEGVESRLARPARRRVGIAVGAGLVVAAAAIVVLALLPARRRLELAVPAAPAPPVVVVGPSPPSPAPAPAPPAPAGHLGPLLPGEAEGSARVRGPVEVELVADGAALTVDRCKGRFVNLRTRDGAHEAVRVRVEGRSRVKVVLDGGVALRGRAQLLVPRGSRVIVRGTAEVIDLSGGAVAISR